MTEFMIELFDGSESGMVITNTPRKVGLANCLQNSDIVARAWNQANGSGFMIAGYPDNESRAAVTREVAQFFGWHVTPPPNYIAIRAMVSGREVMAGQREVERFRFDNGLSVIPIESVVAWRVE
jgi:hypothetical protein